MLPKPKVVGKFVEFFGEGIPALSVTEWATIRKHNSESTATMGFSKGREETLTNLHGTGRGDELCEIFGICIMTRFFVGISRKSEIAQGSFPLAPDSFPASLAITSPL